MTIRPIDMQTLVPRSSEVSRAQHIRESQQAAEQQQAQMQIRSAADQSQRQVIQSENTAHKAGINPDEKGGSGGQSRQGKRGRNRQEVPEAVPEPGKGKRLDVKL